MNAPFAKSEQQPDHDFAAMNGQADKWRGECMQHFAELEQVVESLLQSLRNVPKHGVKVIAGQPVGPAFKHLRELTCGKGPFATKGKVVSHTLSELAPWFEWRAHLTHGVLSIWRGRSGQWLLALAHRPSNGDVIRTYALAWDEAQKLRRLLEKQVVVLRENCRSLTNSLQKP